MSRKKQEQDICREAETRIQSLEQTTETGQFKNSDYQSRFDRNEQSTINIQNELNRFKWLATGGWMVVIGVVGVLKLFFGGH